ncbi:MAG: flagellar basal body-associated FliL family protein [Marinibacterium sp.]|nr:flagellar basal body-associated FliL family protein [Marinibacterium sp.]
MLKKLGNGLLYVGPGVVILGVFAAGHMTITPESDRLQSYRIENGLIPPPEPEAEPDQEKLSPAEAEAEGVERDEEGRIVPPAWRYFSFTMPFSANLGTTDRLYSIEVSLSVFGNPFVGDVVMLRLPEIETQLRPVVLDQMQGMTEDEVRDPATRNALASRIRDALNAALIEMDENIEIEAAMITSVLLT